MCSAELGLSKSNHPFWGIFIFGRNYLVLYGCTSSAVFHTTFGMEGAEPGPSEATVAPVAAEEVGSSSSSGVHGGGGGGGAAQDGT